MAMCCCVAGTLRRLRPAIGAPWNRLKRRARICSSSAPPLGCARGPLLPVTTGTLPNADPLPLERFQNASEGKLEIDWRIQCNRKLLLN